MHQDGACLSRERHRDESPYDVRVSQGFARVLAAAHRRGGSVLDDRHVEHGAGRHFGHRVVDRRGILARGPRLNREAHFRRMAQGPRQCGVRATAVRARELLRAAHDHLRRVNAPDAERPRVGLLASCVCMQRELVRPP